MSSSWAQNFDVLAIRGAPGIGKSTVAELLRPMAPAGALIDIDEIRRMVVKDRLVYGEDNHYEASVLATCASAKALLERGYSPLIVADVFSCKILREFVANLAPQRVIVISLIANDAVLCSRMAQRRGGYINLDVAKRVNRHIQKTAISSIDTTMLDAADVAREVVTLAATLSPLTPQAFAKDPPLSDA